MANTIDLDFANGEYHFALPLVRINEMQVTCGDGIGAIYARVLKGVHQLGDDILLNPSEAAWRVLDIIEPIRQGLIGGGRGIVDGVEIKVTDDVMKRLMANYVYNRPLNDAWSLAISILGATIQGYDPPGGDAPGISPATEESPTTA